MYIKFIGGSTADPRPSGTRWDPPNDERGTRPRPALRTLLHCDESDAVADGARSARNLHAQQTV